MTLGAMAHDANDGIISIGASTIHTDQDSRPIWCYSAMLQGVTTAWGFRAARLFCRLFEIVRSMMAPQLMHFQA